MQQTPSNAEMDEILAANVLDADEHTEKQSEFYSYVQKVKTMNDVNQGLAKMCVKFADATHISCAYRLKKSSPQEQGYEDDGETGQGRTILSTIQEKGMSEICVFLVRYYGGMHLGNRRFEIAKDLTLSAVRVYKMARQNRISQLQQIQRSASQESLASEMSFRSQVGSEQAVEQESNGLKRDWHEDEAATGGGKVRSETEAEKEEN